MLPAASMEAVKTLLELQKGIAPHWNRTVVLKNLSKP
jgi:hypothetical protein